MRSISLVLPFGYRRLLGLRRCRCDGTRSNAQGQLDGSQAHAVSGRIGMSLPGLLSSRSFLLRPDSRSTWPPNTIETTIAVSKAGGFQGLRNCQELRFSWLDAHLKRQHGPAVKIPLNNPYWGTLSYELTTMSGHCRAAVVLARRARRHPSNHCNYRIELWKQPPTRPAC